MARRSEPARQLIRTTRETVPEGTFAVGAGLMVAGLTAYVFQVVTGRVLSSEDYGALNGLWVMVFVVAPGLFLPIEQEVARALAHRRAQHLGGGPLVRRAALLGGILMLGVLVAAVAAWTPLTEELFHGFPLLMIGLLIGIVTYYAQHLTRGTLSGNGRFGPYGMILGSEGVIRVVACVAIAVIGVTTPGPYGLVLVIPPVIAVAIVLRGQRGLVTPGPPAPYSELSQALGYLLVSSVVAQVLGYAAFLAAVVLATDAQRDDLGVLFAGLIVSRIPVLLFQAVQAALLPKLARLAGAGARDDFSAGLRKLVLIVCAIAAAGTVAAFTIGPWAGRLLFGEEKFLIDNRDLGLLALGSGLFIVTLTLYQAMIALEAYARATLPWLAGLVVFLATIALTGNLDLFLRAELSFVLAAGTAACAMGALLLVTMRDHEPTRLDSLVEAIEHEPLEL